MSELQFVVHAVTAQPRRVQQAGQEYLVVPVVMVGAPQQVLNGELVTLDEIGRFPEAWNGRPVVLSHPKRRGRPVSAGDPEISAQAQIGTLYHTSVNGKLRGEMWIDLAKVEALGGDAKLAVQRFEAGEPVEVSTAYYRDLEPQTGQVDGRRYAGIARNIRPDHLAILLHEEGACSWRDGCGAPRVNEDDVAANVLSRARTPTFSGTESTDWSAPTLSDYVAAYDGDVEGRSVADMPAAFKRWVAGHTLLGEANADTLRDLSFFPVVNPRTGRLNENALRAVIGGRGSQAQVAAGAKRSAQSKARSLLEEHFDMGENSMQTNLRFRVWAEEQARGWLEDNGYSADNMQKLANHFAFRQTEPAGFDGFTDDMEPFGFGVEDGVTATFGVTVQAGEVQQRRVQSIKFYHGEEDAEARPAVRGAVSSNEGAFNALREAFRYLVFGPENDTEGGHIVDEREKLIQQIAANEAAGWTDEELEALEVPVLKKIAAMAAAPTPETGRPAPSDARQAGEPPAPEADQETPPETNEPQAVAEPEGWAELKAMVDELGGPGKLKKALAGVTANAEAEKSELVARLAANDRCAFDEDELKAMATAQLRKLDQSLVPANFAGRPAARRRQTEEPTFLVPPAIVTAARETTVEETSAGREAA